MRGPHGENKFGKPGIALSAEFAFVVPGVDGDGEDESADDGVDEGRGVHHGEAVHDCCDEKDADHGAGENAAFATEEAGSAKDGGGDDDEFMWGYKLTFLVH